MLGLVNRVAATAEALDDEVEALVASIVAKPAVAVAMGKALFYRQIRGRHRGQPYEETQARRWPAT